MPQLSIIIPFGTSKERDFIKKRVIQKAKDLRSDKNIEVIFVEGFSSLIHQDLPQIIQENGHRYLKINQSQFSQGGCRNFGVINASANVVMPLDVDYHISNENLQKLLKLIKIKNIANNPNALMCLPIIFLNEAGTQSLIQYSKDLWDTLVCEDLISGKREWIDFFSLASSSLVVNRHKFLEVGGNDKAFVGHGYEDYNFFARLLLATTQFEKMPKTLEYDGGLNFFRFKGFRAWFSLLGNEASLYGIYLYHFWHIKPNQNGYLDRKKINLQLFCKSLKNHSIEPLQTNDAKDKKVLLLGENSHLLQEALRGASVYMGEILHKYEEEFFEGEKFLQESFLEFLTRKRITQVLFSNPYSSERSRKIYEFVKQHCITYLCFGKGALPDSWFFDERGFNADSKSYDEKYWNQTLNVNQIAQIKEYIAKTLESQRGKQGLSTLKKRFGALEKRIVFVSLREQNDLMNEEFLKIVRELASEFKQVAFVMKTHAFSLNKKADSPIIFVPKDTNLLALLESCECILTNDSDIGVYAILERKPCVIYGEAFCSFDGFNKTAKDKENLIRHFKEVLESRFIFDEEKSLRFLHYLRFRFYSFGKSFYDIGNSQSPSCKTMRIDFYQILLGGKECLRVEEYQKTYFSLKSLIYKNYLYEIYNKNFLIKILNLLIPDFLLVKISHTKFYRLFKKLFYEPEKFIKDSKSPLVKSMGRILQKL